MGFRSLLETLMGALQAGNTLLSKLKELGAEGTLDSRPERIRSSVSKGKSVRTRDGKLTFLLIICSNITSARLAGRAAYKAADFRSHL